MNVPSGVSYTATSFSIAPVLVTGDSQAALLRASRTVEASGYRVTEAVPVGAAAARMGLQAAASAIWIELSSDDADIDEILSLAREVSRERRCGTVLSVPLPLLAWPA